MQAYVPTLSIHDNTAYVVMAGDNFRLPWVEAIESREEFLKDLKELKRELHQCRKAIFQGGEPTLQKPALLSLLEYCNDSGIETELHTNLTKPAVIQDILLFTENVVVRYNAPFNVLFDKVTRSSTFFIQSSQIISDIKKSINLIMHGNMNIVFRTDIVPGLLYKKEDLAEMAKELDGIDCRWELRPFSPGGKMKNINPPTESFLNNLKAFLLEKYPQLRIDVLPVEMFPDKSLPP